jgi:hypothetical protein
VDKHVDNIHNEIKKSGGEIDKDEMDKKRYDRDYRVRDSQCHCISYRYLAIYTVIIAVIKETITGIKTDLKRNSANASAVN